MNIQILKSGPYAKFTQDGVKAQDLEAGATIEYPDTYAQWLINEGLAQQVTITEVTKPEVIVSGVLPDERVLKQVDMARHSKGDAVPSAPNFEERLTGRKRKQ